MQYLIYRSNLTYANDKIDCYLQLMIVYDMSYYVKLTVLSIKTIPSSLTLFVLLISPFYQHDMSHNNADISKTKRVRDLGIVLMVRTVNFT